MPSLPWRRQRRVGPTTQDIDDAIANSRSAAEEARAATAAVQELTDHIIKIGDTS